MARIINYIDPDGLVILIRRHGGSAFVEADNGRDVVVTNRSIGWVRRLCQAQKWVRP